MGKDLTKLNRASGYFIFIKAFIIEIAVTAFFVTVFALIMYLVESGYKYASVFATVSVALGAFAASFYAAGKTGKRGWLTGMIIGGVTFVIITLAALVADSGSVTYNTLFHFIIIMLSSLIGAVIGVNRGTSRKYI